MCRVDSMINKDLLLLGEDFKINDKLKIKHPTVKEILQLEEKYHIYCDPFLAKTEDYMVPLYDLNIKYFEVEMYEIFLKTYESEVYHKKTDLLESINWWLQGDYNFKLVVQQDKMPVLYDNITNTTIDAGVFYIMSIFIKTINGVKVENKYTKVSDSLLKFLVEKERRRITRLQKKKVNKPYTGFLHDIISSVSNCGHGLNIFNVFDLKVYQLYNSIGKILQIKEVDKINIGLMTGNINPKKTKIDTDWITIKEKEHIVGNIG